MNRSVVFFDIDGTLWDNTNYIPDSTVRAIKRLRENGHLAFINTGRCKGYVRSRELLDIGFDGMVAGCGTMVEMNGELLLYKSMPPELTAHSIEVVRGFGFRPILEGIRNLYMEDEEFAGDPYGDKLRRELGDDLLPINANWGKWEISKFSCATEGCNRQACYDALEEHFDFLVHNTSVTEFVPKGYNKGTGVLFVCERLGIDIKDSYAFGDSPNDEHMLATAGHAVVMGSGNSGTKMLAEYVTADLRDDGVEKGLKYFGLLG